MSDERSTDLYAVNDALKQISLNIPMESAIKLDGLSLRPQHELDAFSMGSGITARTLEMISSEFGGQAVEDLTNNQGTTIFLGNGSSSVPLEISRKQKENNQIPNPKIIIDQVNLDLLLRDLKTIETELQKEGFTNTFDIGQQRERVSSLVEASLREEENLSIQTGLIGKDNFADLIGVGDIVINAYGPGERTLQAQLSFVRPGGVLYASYKPEDLKRLADQIGPKAFEMIEKVEPVGKGIIKITRKR